jgi:hypothetical protein
VIEKLGLQINVEEETPFQSKKRRMKHALLAERGSPIPAQEGFEFIDVYYRGQQGLDFTLFFTSLGTFEVRDGEQNVLEKGEMGVPVHMDGAVFTLIKAPKALKLRTEYKMNIASLEETVLGWRKRVDVSPMQGDRSLLELTLMSESRMEGKRFINTLMELYQDYLKGESERISKEQLTYLEKRRGQLCEKMDDYLQTHVAYLKKNLHEKGTLTLGQQLSFFQEHKQSLTQDLLKLDQEQALLSGSNPVFSSSFGKEIEGLLGTLRESSRERDEIELALFQRNDLEGKRVDHLKTLNALDRSQLRAKTGIDRFFASLAPLKKERSQILLDVGEFGHILSPDAHELQKITKEKASLIEELREKHSIGLSQTFAENQLRLLSLQEGVLKQRLFHGVQRDGDYRGVDLKTARQLLVEYLRKRDRCRETLREMAFAKEEIEKEGAELVSLAHVFPDPLCQSLVSEMGQIRQKLRKERSLTEKEIERLKKHEKTLKDDLLRHMDQTVLLIALEEERAEEHIRGVQIALVDLIGQEVSLIEKQIEDRVSEELQQIREERKLVTKELDQILKEMEEVPDAWLKEHQLNFSAEMNQGMLEALVHLVESKSIESNLMTIESKPIDWALSSQKPLPPLLRFFGVIGAFIGAVVTFGFCLMYALIKGVPLSLKNMTLRGKETFGTFSKQLDFEKSRNNLEILRRVSHRISKEESGPLVMTLVHGDKDLYSKALADLLKKEGKKVLMIDLNFRSRIKGKNGPGLIHFLEGEAQEPRPIERPFGNYIPMGGKSLFGNELLKGKKFEAFIEHMKEMYDIILLTVMERAESALPKTLFRASHMMVIRLEETSFETLKPYFFWEEEGHSLAFVS